MFSPLLRFMFGLAVMTLVLLSVSTSTQSSSNGSWRQMGAVSERPSWREAEPRRASHSFASGSLQRMVEATSQEELLKAAAPQLALAGVPEAVQRKMPSAKPSPREPWRPQGLWTAARPPQLAARGVFTTKLFTTAEPATLPATSPVTEATTTASIAADIGDATIESMEAAPPTGATISPGTSMSAGKAAPPPATSVSLSSTAAPMAHLTLDPAAAESGGNVSTSAGDIPSRTAEDTKGWNNSFVLPLGKPQPMGRVAYAWYLAGERKEFEDYACAILVNAWFIKQSLALI